MSSNSSVRSLRSLSHFWAGWYHQFKTPKQFEARWQNTACRWYTHCRFLIVSCISLLLKPIIHALLFKSIFLLVAKIARIFHEKNACAGRGNKGTHSRFGSKQQREGFSLFSYSSHSSLIARIAFQSVQMKQLSGFNSRNTTPKRRLSEALG